MSQHSSVPHDGSLHMIKATTAASAITVSLLGCITLWSGAAVAATPGPSQVLAQATPLTTQVRMKKRHRTMKRRGGKSGPAMGNTTGNAGAR